MKVPVTVVIDPDTKKYEIEIGIPSTAALMMKEAGISKGSGTSGTEWVGDVPMESVVKIARTKLEDSYASSVKSIVKTVAGTCLSLGIKIEGKSPREITAEINDGKWNDSLQ
jgi:large subunit ribosomal protein L11